MSSCSSSTYAAVLLGLSAAATIGCHEAPRPSPVVPVATAQAAPGADQTIPVVDAAPKAEQPARPWLAADAPLKLVADTFWEAIFACDRERAESLMLTHEQRSELSAKPRTAAQWQQRVDGFFRDFMVSGRDRARLEYEEAIVEPPQTLLAIEHSKLRRDVLVANTDARFRVDGRSRTFSPYRFFFMKTAQGWRFSPTK